MKNEDLLTKFGSLNVANAEYDATMGEICRRGKGRSLDNKRSFFVLANEL